MEHWEIEMEKAKIKQAIAKRYPEIGKIVKFKGEYGIVLLDEDFVYDPNEDQHECGVLYVRWDTRKEFDSEQFFWDYEYPKSYELKFINKDGSLKEEYKKRKR